MHFLAAVRTCDGDFVNIRSVKLYGHIDILICKLYQFLSGTYAVKVSAFAAPDWNRCTPVSGTGYSPVLNFGKPVAETLFAYEFREPVYSVVIGYQLIFKLAHLYIP